MPWRVMGWRLFGKIWFNFSFVRFYYLPEREGMVCVVESELYSKQFKWI